MKKKALIVATVANHIAGFHIPYMKYLQNIGVEVHVCAKNDYENENCNILYCDSFYEVNFSRSPFYLKNIGAHINLKNVIKEGNYDLIRCHTSVAAILTRLAARKNEDLARRLFILHMDFIFSRVHHDYTGCCFTRWSGYALG